MTDRRTAVWVGILFLVGSISGALALSLQESVVGGNDYLTAASARSDRLTTGVLLQLVMALAVVGIAVVIYPVLRRRTERLAVGYVVARTMEAVIYVVSATGLLALITVSEKYVAGHDSGYAAVGRAILAERDWSGHAVLDATVFTVGALMLNSAFYRSRLVPSWLSLWGILGAVAYLAAGLLVLYGLEPLSTPQVVLEAPLGLQEIALAGWLIVKGFTTPTPEAGRPTSRAAEDRQLATT